MPDKVINGILLNDLYISFKALFQKGFENTKVYWDKIATRVPSTTSEESYDWIGSWPTIREWIGERKLRQLKAFNYRIKNKKFESTVIIDRESIEDDQYGKFAMQFEMQGQEARKHPNRVIFSLLKNGFSELCYDGQYFFDTDHPVGINTPISVSNYQPGTGLPWFLLDTSKALKPMILQIRKDYEFQNLNSKDDERVIMQDEFLYGIRARLNAGFGFWQTAFASQQDLNATNFEAAYAAMREFTNDYGDPLDINPTILVYPPNLHSKAKALINAAELPGGGTNTNYKAVEIMDVPWLK